MNKVYRWGWLSGVKGDGSPYEVKGRWAAYRSTLVGYMDRFILKTPWGSLRLHRILTADPDRHPHDHPFSFSSLILWGGYTEERYPAVGAGFGLVQFTRYHMGEVVRMNNRDVHRIIAVEPNTVTLVWASPITKGWGFLTPGGMVSWRRYFNIGE